MVEAAGEVVAELVAGVEGGAEPLDAGEWGALVLVDELMQGEGGVEGGAAGEQFAADGDGAVGGDFAEEVAEVLDAEGGEGEGGLLEGHAVGVESAVRLDGGQLGLGTDGADELLGQCALRVARYQLKQLIVSQDSKGMGIHRSDSEGGGKVSKS